MTSIIPEKPNLFNSRTYKLPVVKRQPRTVSQIKKQEEKIKEEQPVFDVPVIDLPKLALQPSPATQVIIRKKEGWRKWVVIISGSVIVIGLGVYFLL